MATVWTEITYDNLTNLDEALKLHDESFSLEVREPHQIFLRSLKYATSSFPNTFRFLVGFEENELVAYATGHYIADVNCGFIVYIATNPLLRNKGLGTQTLLRLEELLVQDANSAGNKFLRAMILETERKEVVHTEAERVDCIKREQFFERNGYHQFSDIKYVQPPLRGGQDKVPLNLFVKNLHANTITIDEIRAIIRAVYREKYGSVNALEAHILIECLQEMGIDP